MIQAGNKPLDDAVRAILVKYPHYKFFAYREEQYMRTVVRAAIIIGPREWHYDAFIDDENLSRAHEPSEVIYTVLEIAAQKLTVGLGEGVTGRYPFTRLWADRHLSYTKKLWRKPSQDVPGWVHDKFRHQDEYPKDGTVQAPVLEARIVASSIDDYGNDPQTSKSLADAAQLQKISKPDLHNASADKILKEVKEVGKRKVKVVKGRAIKPEQIKKPLCSRHNEKMDFDAVRQVWKCNADGCNVIARPKGEENIVRIGKGNIQCRLISNEGEQTVVLISDDNVCLDITKFVDVEKLLDIYDAVSIADSASDAGRETFSINDPKPLPLNMALTIMGASDLVVSKGK